MFLSLHKVEFDKNVPTNIGLIIKGNALEFIYEYGLFLAKIATIVVAIGIVIGLVAGAAMKGKSSKKGELYLENISESKEQEIDDVKKAMLDKDQIKALEKEQKKLKKAKSKSKNDDVETKNKLFVVNFNGSVDAQEVESLREEISCIVSVAEENDEVLINLESPGGVVHGYGLAASQIDRLKNANLKVTVAVDKVAASGGYMMACVADKIISAPFAIIGSIGVVAQIPNINRLLKKVDIDIEQHTAGDYKRTLTVLGENTDAGREKFKQELNETHDLFKQFVADHRPNVDIDKVATGEHWYGTQAKELGLVDEILTSDDFVLSNLTQYDVYKIEFKIKHNLAEKFGIAAELGIKKVFSALSSWSVTNTK